MSVEIVEFELNITRLCTSVVIVERECAQVRCVERDLAATANVEMTVNMVRQIDPVEV